MDVLSCIALAHELPVRMLAIYSHLVPAALAVFLGFYAYRATNRSASSTAFASFSLAVATWLIADVLLWTFPSYDLVAFIWSWIDFVDVIFFILAAYFFGVLARGSVSRFEKLALLALSIPSFIFTVAGRSVIGLDQAWCEMLNNNAAVLYKSAAEWIAILAIAISLIIAWGRVNRKRRFALGVVFVALMLFLATFSVTEYLAARTGVYEINLYGLFALPLFLIVMVFAVTNLEIFKIRYLGAQLLIYVLILLSASQLLFIKSSADTTLSLGTLGVSIVIGAILLRNAKRELDDVVEIERLAEQLSSANSQLHELDQLKSKFLSFASHQLKSPLTAIKWQSQLLIDGTTGKLPKDAVDTAKEIEESADRLVELVNEFLNLRKLEEGKMDYTFEPTDIAETVSAVVNELRQLAGRKGLQLSFENHASRTLCAVDRQKFSQVVQNLVDNAVKYTDHGFVRVFLEDAEPGAVNMLVSDSGHGIDPAVVGQLFEQFVRDKKDAVKIEGTGLGLYIAKQVIDAHHGRIWATSQGPGKGSTFTVQLKTISR